MKYRCALDNGLDFVSKFREVGNGKVENNASTGKLLRN